MWFVQNVRQLFYVMLGVQNKKRRGNDVFLFHIILTNKNRTFWRYYKFCSCSHRSFLTKLLFALISKLKFSFLCFVHVLFEIELERKDLYRNL